MKIKVNNESNDIDIFQFDLNPVDVRYKAGAVINNVEYVRKNAGSDILNRCVVEFRDGFELGQLIDMLIEVRENYSKTLGEWKRNKL